jgi:[phosphatase 2A protein]-leucine-carboxy methyltransferase
MMDRQLSFHSDESGVIATNDDASESKRSCVKLNYYKDEYIGNFVKICEKKAPEINRGYYARVKGVEICVEKFLKVRFAFIRDRDPFFHAIFFIFASPAKTNRQQQKTGAKCQIINLGCGFDTLYWRLRDAGHLVQNFIELDFPTVTAKKCYQIKRNKVLLDKIHAEGKNIRMT